MIKVLVSSCLLGVHCAYDGSGRRFLDVCSLKEQFTLFGVCPETLSGFGSPRDKYEVKGGDGENVLSGDAEVVSAKGILATKEFIKGAEKVLKLVLTEKIRYAVLKAGSPSCGHGNIYNGNFDGTQISGSGVTAALLVRHGVRVFTEEQVHLLLKEAGQKVKKYCGVDIVRSTIVGRVRNKTSSDSFCDKRMAKRTYPDFYLC